GRRDGDRGDGQAVLLVGEGDPGRGRVGPHAVQPPDPAVGGGGVEAVVVGRVHHDLPDAAAQVYRPDVLPSLVDTGHGRQAVREQLAFREPAHWVEAEALVADAYGRSADERAQRPQR